MRSLGRHLFTSAASPYIWAGFLIAIGLGLLLIWAISCRCAPGLWLASVGAVTLGAGLFGLMSRLIGDAGVRRRRARWGEIAMIACGVGWMGGLLILGLPTALRDPREGFEIVTGKPVEMRTQPWLQVWMEEGGPVYSYTCGGRRKLPCAYASDRPVLERWPEPQFIVMEVSGHTIRGLNIDDKPYIDAARVAGSMRRENWMMLTFGAVLLAVLVLLGVVRLRARLSDYQRPDPVDLPPLVGERP